MKALSICQPWATLLVIGAKQFETRKWKANHRGPLVIHASKTKAPSAMSLCGAEPFKSALAKAGVTDPSMLEFGKIIGIVNLDDCMIAEHLEEKDGLTETERNFGDFRPSRYAWKVSNPRLVIPTSFTGRIGLFEVPDEMLVEFEEAKKAFDRLTQFEGAKTC